MEASGSTPTPPPEGESTPADAPAAATPTEPAAPAATTPTEPTAPPPPPTGPPADAKAGGGWRALGLILALALVFAVAVMVSVMVDLANGPLCKDVQFTLLGPVEDCWDVSSAGRIAAEVLGWPSIILGSIGTILALAFTFTGRRGQLLLRVTFAAVILGAASIFVDKIF
jgi:hypothetical protein